MLPPSTQPHGEDKASQVVNQKPSWTSLPLPACVLGSLPQFLTPFFMENYLFICMVAMRNSASTAHNP